MKGVWTMKAAVPYTLYLLLIALFKCLAAQSPPQIAIKDESRQQIVRPGISVLIECPVRNSKSMIFEWYKDKDPIMTFGNPRLRLLSNGALRIKETLYDDTGIYKCRAVNGFGSVEFNTTLLIIGNEKDYEEYEAIFDPGDTPEDEAEISLTFKPRILYVTEEKSPITKALGATFMLQCVATGHPKPEIMWYKDGNPISHHFRIGRWALKFTKSIPTDTGNYTCVASNPLGKTSHSFVLEVGEPGRKAIWGKPLITGSNTTVDEGKRAVMECGVQSESFPHIDWLKQVSLEPGKITMEGESFNVLTKPFTLEYILKDGIYFHKLIIDNTQMEDAGKYVCLAANTYGYDYQFTYLKVIPRNNKYHTAISFPIVVTMIAVAVALLGCIFSVLFYCRPKPGRRHGESSIEAPMVTKDFIPLHSEPSHVLKCPLKLSKSRTAQTVTYVAGLSSNVV